MTRRLFPPAYTARATRAAEQEYRKLVDTALVNHHPQAFAVVAATAEADILSRGGVQRLAAAVGSLRLVLGTRLDVSEDMDPAGSRTTRPPPSTPSSSSSASSSTSWSRSSPTISRTRAGRRGPCDPSANLQKP